MSVSEVSVANDCLIRLGSEPISALSQECKRAKALNAVWDQTRDAELRRYHWKFAIKRALLSPTSTTPEFEYDYEYDLPADCIKVIGISDDIDEDENADDLPFSVEGDKKLRCDESEIYLKYIFRQDDPASWDSCFAEAFALRLAMKIGYALTQSSAVVDSVTKEYTAFVQDARTLSSMESSVKQAVIDGWLGARY